MKTTIIFSLAFLTAIICGCSKNNEEPEIPTVPFDLSTTWVVFPRVGEPVTLDILSGNGGYKITPYTATFYQAGIEDPIIFTVSEDYVKARIEEDKIILEMVALFDKTPGVSYIVSDSRDQKVHLSVNNPGTLGGL